VPARLAFRQLSEARRLVLAGMGVNTWEAGIFAQAGVYSFMEFKDGETKEKTKTRGFKIATPREFFLNDVRNGWRNGVPVIPGP
jgi:hypothetical protein